MKVNLAAYNNDWYKPGANKLKLVLWFICNGLLLTSFLPGSFWRVIVLKLFGAKIGTNVTIKPGVSIKYPWRLSIGNHTWIGENVWIDNLDNVTIGDNCCISQGALLLCGNHNYKQTTFDLITKSIVLENGVWVGAKSLVAPGVLCGNHSVITAGSVATTNLDAWGIYAGNPAIKIRERMIEK